MTSTRNAGAVLVDLDGTLISSNSFHRWITFILFSGLRCVPLSDRVVARAKIAFLCGLRLLGLISHARLKRGVQLAWAHSMLRAAEGCERLEIERFVKSIMCRADARVLALVRDMERAGATAVMVTAAPSEYATALSQAFAFAECLATVHGQHPRWEENARDIKCKKVMEALEDGRVSRPLSLFTDHLDDLPLMAVADSVFLVGSIAKERAALAKRLGTGVSVQTLGGD